MASISSSSYQSNTLPYEFPIFGAVFRRNAYFSRMSNLEHDKIKKLTPEKFRKLIPDLVCGFYESEKRVFSYLTHRDIRSLSCVEKHTYSCFQDYLACSNICDEIYSKLNIREIEQILRHAFTRKERSKRTDNYSEPINSTIFDRIVVDQSTNPANVYLDFNKDFTQINLFGGEKELALCLHANSGQFLVRTWVLSEEDSAILKFENEHKITKQFGPFPHFVQPAHILEDISYIIHTNKGDKKEVNCVCISSGLTPFYPGVNLKNLMRKYNRRSLPFQRIIPYKRQIRWALEITGSLCEMHKINKSHCDVRPENIFIDFDGFTPIVRLGDFGAAQDFNAQLNTFSWMYVRFDYLPNPNLYKVDQYYDVHSLGITFLTLFENFSFIDYPSVTMGHLITTLTRDFQPTIYEIIDEMDSTNPQRTLIQQMIFPSRIQMQDVKRELETMLSQPLSPPRRCINPTIIIRSNSGLDLYLES